MSATLLGSIARTTAPQTALRRFLALDAVVTTGNGLAYLAFSAPLGRLLGIGQGLLLELGIFLVLYGAGVAWLASRRQPPVLPVKVVIEGNYAWAALSLAAVAFWLSPTVAGAAWVPMQAVTVASFALLQQLALRAVASRGQ
ncbi:MULTISPECIES: hypothetical protein [unclassified Streptomyces]|uniref:hypothetical protein n=1 Tax=unclassified Streptomyces TaxID=2593676 RepID=UPI001BECD4C5|nr:MULTISPECIES: hypothetical protein [unclassified Streptomyces]MBT2408879.1 hypothetical protein [Streptomyces sp. ISL-21]MBT2611467.1 hypothetical protein [Streptomyces sp. ISL-87]